MYYKCNDCDEIFHDTEIENDRCPNCSGQNYGLYEDEEVYETDVDEGGDS